MAKNKRDNKGVVMRIRVEFIMSNGQEFREDSSLTSLDFINRIENEIKNNELHYTGEEYINPQQIASLKIYVYE